MTYQSSFNVLDHSARYGKSSQRGKMPSSSYFSQKLIDSLEFTFLLYVQTVFLMTDCTCAAARSNYIENPYLDIHVILKHYTGLKFKIYTQLRDTIQNIKTDVSIENICSSYFMPREEFCCHAETIYRKQPLPCASITACCSKKSRLDFRIIWYSMCSTS